MTQIYGEDGELGRLSANANISFRSRELHRKHILKYDENRTIYLQFSAEATSESFSNNISRNISWILFSE